MKISCFHRAILPLFAVVWLVASGTFAAAASPELLKAKKEAEAKGYTFFTSHDEIVAEAKKEGSLRVLAEMEPPTMRASAQAFMKKYPFINLQIQEITGTDSAQRFILELKAGRAKDWDIINLSREFFTEYVPYISKTDLLGMAERGVLAIPPKMVDPKNRNIAAFSTRFQVTAYNKKTVPAAQVPKTWEDILKPEFKGRKFAADIRPTEIAALVPAWGLEKTLDFARKVALQQPIWVRGGSRTLTSIAVGEIPMMIGPNFHTTKRAQQKDPTGSLQYTVLEPVPLKLALELAIQVSPRHPNAAVLWLEWLASLEAQKLLDEHEPLSSSVHVRGGVVEQEVRGKRLSVVSWEENQKMQSWQRMVVEAYGFPKAEVAR